MNSVFETLYRNPVRPDGSSRYQSDADATLRDKVSVRPRPSWYVPSYVAHVGGNARPSRNVAGRFVAASSRPKRRSVRRSFGADWTVRSKSRRFPLSLDVRDARLVPAIVCCRIFPVDHPSLVVSRSGGESQGPRPAAIRFLDAACRLRGPRTTRLAASSNTTSVRVTGLG